MTVGHDDARENLMIGYSLVASCEAIGIDPSRRVGCFPSVRVLADGVRIPVVNDASDLHPSSEDSAPRSVTAPARWVELDAELLAAVADVDRLRLRANLELSPMERLAAVSRTMRWAGSFRRVSPS